MYLFIITFIFRNMKECNNYNENKKIKYNDKYNNTQKETIN